MATTYAWYIKNRYIYIISPGGQTASNVSEDEIIRKTPLNQAETKSTEGYINDLFRSGENDMANFAAYESAFNEMVDKVNSYTDDSGEKYFTGSEFLSAADYYDIQNDNCAMLKGAKGDKGDTIVPNFICDDVESLPPTATATVSITEEIGPTIPAGTYSMHFGIPRGETGTVRIEDAVGEQIVSQVDFDAFTEQTANQFTDYDNDFNIINETIGKRGELSDDNFDDSEKLDYSIFELINNNTGRIRAIEEKGDKEIDWLEDQGSTSTYNAVGHSSDMLDTQFFKASNVLITNSSVKAQDGFYETSDERLKDFHGEINPEFITEIPTEYFTWKAMEDKQKRMNIGTSAQAVQKHYPELVHRSANGELSVDYAKLSIVAISAIKELKKEVAELKDEIAELKK